MIRVPLGLALVLTCSAACSVVIHVPSYEIPPAPPASRFVVGRAKVDITPPPGFPMGGHSIAGAVARGTWTRLHARAFYFRDAKGRTAALVSCELFAISAGLRAEVARLVAQRGVPLPPESLVLAASHTHHGPGNYLSSPVYNGFSSLWSGFDARLHTFLANRIADAVVQAEADARASDVPHRVTLHGGALPELVRNRSIAAFLRNPDAGDLLNPATGCGCDLDCARYRAVDSTLRVLEIRRGDGAAAVRIALLVFFAVHPTALTHDNPLYSSDLTGWAMTRLERSDPAVTAGFFNGAEGDVSPRWIRQDRTDLERSASLLADGVEKALASPALASSTNAEVDARSDAPRANPPSETTAELAPPEFGVASIGGAEDGRTFLYHYGWHAGVRGAPRKGQGVKVPALDLPSLQLLDVLKPTSLLAPPSHFPRDMPVSLLRIGDVLAIGTVPVEMTTAMGLRLRDALQKLESPRRFVLVGLANEYLSYVTTPEEYDAQDYEGASTIFGPRTGPVLQRLLERLSTRPPSAPPRSVRAARFPAGPAPAIPFGPALDGHPRDSLDEGLASAMCDATGRVTCLAPRFVWPEDPTDDWEATRRRVAVLEESASGWRAFDDDGGSDLLTVLADGSSPTRRLWGALWLVPPGADRTRRHAFRVEPRRGEPICSEPFRLGAPPSSQSPAAVPIAERCP